MDVDQKSTVLHHELNGDDFNTLGPALEWIQMNEDYNTTPRRAIEMVDNERETCREFGATHRTHLASFLVSLRALNDPLWYGREQNSRSVREYVQYKRTVLVSHFVSELTRVSMDVHRAYADVRRDTGYDLAHIGAWDLARATDTIAAVRGAMSLYFSEANKALVQALLQETPVMPALPSMLMQPIQAFARDVQQITDIPEETLVNALARVWKDAIKTVAFAANKSYVAKDERGEVFLDMRVPEQRDGWNKAFLKRINTKMSHATLHDRLEGERRGSPARMELHKYVCKRINQYLVTVERRKLHAGEIAHFPASWFYDAHLAAQLTGAFHADVLALDE
jgi:hypothetical protein